jgi:two-component system response regulator AtoC
MKRVLIVDDDKALARSLQIHLAGQGYDVRITHTLRDAEQLLAADADDIVFLDLKLPDGDSRGLLSRIQEKWPRTIVVMISGHQDMQATIQAIRAGAFDYIRKPLDLDQILSTLVKADRQMKSRPLKAEEPALGREAAPAPREIVGRNPALVTLLKQIAVLSESRVTVLIQGETGTGKELVARALHEATNPRDPFVAVNCGGIVPSLLESELFGHEKGAFTGATARKIGRLEHAGKGTIFFDEIGDLPLDVQAKLLRALQEAEFERVGGTEVLPLQARVIAATHRDLAEMVREGTFRQDLFFRLAVTPLTIPPLRERPEDLPMLAEYLLQRLAEQLGKPPARLAPEALEKLRAHTWPGNVRELENVLTRAAALSRGDSIHAEGIRFDLGTEAAASFGFEEILPLRDLEARYVKHALDRMEWNITRTAEVLQISPTTLRKKIADYGLRAREG